MHSGADVEAFTASLNRDMEGDTSTSQDSQPSDSDGATLSQGSNHTSSQLFPQWQTSNQHENANGQSPQDLNGSQQQDQHSFEMELQQHGSGPENQQQQIDTSQELNCIPLEQKQLQDDHQQRQTEPNTLHLSQTQGVQNSEKNPVHIQEPCRAHYPENPKLQKMNSQQAMATEQAINPMNRWKQVPFALLLPVIQPQLDKDRAMQLQTLYLKLKKSEISKGGFVRNMRAIVGGQMLKMAVNKFQAQGARNSQTGPNQISLQSQASAQPWHLKMPPVGARAHQGTVPPQKGIASSTDASHLRPSAAQPKTDSSNATMDDNGQKSREIECQSDSHGIPASHMSSSSLNNINQERERPTIPIQGLSKQQQQPQFHFSQSSFPINGSTGGNYHPISGTNVKRQRGSDDEEAGESSKEASMDLDALAMRMNDQAQQASLDKIIGMLELRALTQKHHSDLLEAHTKAFREFREDVVGRFDRIEKEQKQHSQAIEELQRDIERTVWQPEMDD